MRLGFKTGMAVIAGIMFSSGIQEMAGAAENVPLEAFVVQPEHCDTWHGIKDRISLNGLWKLDRTVNVMQVKDGKVVPTTETIEDPPSDKGIEQGYFRPDFDDAKWEKFPVPYVWNYSLEEIPLKQPFAGVGYYRTKFEVPTEKTFTKAFLHFDSVQHSCTVWVNGKEVGDHTNRPIQTRDASGTLDGNVWLDDFELDITEALRTDGSNVLVVRVFDDGLPLDTFYPVKSPHPDDGGITGPVYVEFRNDVYFNEILLNSVLDRSELEMNLLAVNYADAPREMELTAECSPFESKFYKSPSPSAPVTKTSLGRITLAPGESKLKFSMKLEDPVPWDVDRPMLYHLRLFADGKNAGQERFGFRHFETKNGQFLLNGHPVYLKGFNPAREWTFRHRLYNFNHAGLLRETLKGFKGMNVTSLRVHTGPEADIYYDICDELGIISEDDYSPNSEKLSPEEIERDEMIQQVQVGSYFDNNGKFRKDFDELLGHWVHKLHNHPSVCMFTGGNELGYRQGSEEQLALYMNLFYDTVKKYDVQQRPVTCSSGLCVWKFNTPVKSDFHDFHNYGSGRAGVVDTSQYDRAWYDHLERIYGKVEKPVMNGETVHAVHLDETIPGIVDEQGHVDKGAYVKWVSQTNTEKKVASVWPWITSRYIVSQRGIRHAATVETMTATQSDMSREAILAYRRDMDFLEGVAFHHITPTGMGLNTRKAYYSPEQLQAAVDTVYAHPWFQAVGNAMAPQIAVADEFNRHLFAGDTLKANVYLINNKYRANEKDLAVEASVIDSDGKSMATEQLVFNEVPQHSRQLQPLAMQLPANLPEGDYTLRLKLSGPDGVRNEQAFAFDVTDAAVRSMKISSDKRIALYEPNQSSPSTRHILKQVGIESVDISDFSKLANIDVLIVGAGAMDEELKNQSAVIQNFLNNGGVVLFFEQSTEGDLPFIKDYKLVKSGSMFYADQIEEDHAAVRDLRPIQWRLWSGDRVQKDGAWSAVPKQIYNTYILPVSEGVIVSGADRNEGRNMPKMGMVVCEIPVGKGKALFCQALVTERYSVDAAATRLVQNLLRYTLQAL